VLAAALLLGGPARVHVPDVVGSTISVATQRLENEGFDVKAIRDTSDKPRNTVVGQNPPAGQLVDKGSQVTINVSDGPPIRTVPDVVGQGRRTARRTLTGAGFRVSERFAFSGDVRLNRVIAQSPVGDQQAGQGSTVTITVSRGADRLTVPGVVGRSEENARSQLQGAGFAVVSRSRETSEADAGTVLAQDPGPNTQADRGSTVTLTVAAAPRRVEVPDVVGRSQNSATKRLSGAGFEVDVEEQTVDSPDDDGIVQKQSPAGGRRADRGTAVTISVGRFAPDLNPDPGSGGQTTTPGGGTTTPRGR
ncbi:MAG: PASTA domain-containing protein, partial [Actinomycetota bacterium]|nr:PASTA domain-containing protein [Actinomycetota bacterium]